MPNVEVLLKERMICVTSALTESMHRKLLILVTRTAKKEVDIIRELFDAALQDVED